MGAYERLMDLYMARTKRSAALYERARKVLPGGIGGNAKFMKPYPLYIKGARGSKIVDIDGNEYVDFIQSNGVSILGHSPAVVVEAVTNVVKDGLNPVYATETEVELAERISHHMPWLERVRFCNTGSEATMFCLRISRAFTKRDKIAKFEGHYHGQGETTLILSLIHISEPTRPY